MKDKNQNNRFLPDPDDLVDYPHGTVSRFGQDKGSIRRDTVQDIAEVDGRSVIVRRGADNLDKMRGRLSLSHSQYMAGRELKDAWAASGYSEMKTSNLSDARGGASSPLDHIERTRRARDFIRAIITLLGGDLSPRWIVIKYHIALDQSLRSLAGGKGGRRVTEWKNLLASALEDMGRDYDRRHRGSPKRKIQRS